MILLAGGGVDGVDLVVDTVAEHDRVCDLREAVRCAPGSRCEGPVAEDPAEDALVHGYSFTLDQHELDRPARDDPVLHDEPLVGQGIFRTDLAYDRPKQGPKEYNAENGNSIDDILIIEIVTCTDAKHDKEYESPENRTEEYCPMELRTIDD